MSTMKNRWMNRDAWNIAVAVMVTAILFVTLGFLFAPVYCLNDDLMIQSILSGRFSGAASKMAVYLNEPLSGILAFLYDAMPSVAWFGLFLLGCYILCFFLILYGTLQFFTKEKEGKSRIVITGSVCIICILVFLEIFLAQFLMPHYTVVAAVTGGTAVYLFLILDESREWKKTLRSTVPSILLLLLCYLTRTKVFFMVVPFLAVAGIYRMLKTKSIVNYLMPVILLAAGVLIFMLIGKLSYGTDSWKDYPEYNDARTRLYDYAGVWNEEKAFRYYESQGYTEEEIEIYLDYNVLLNENLTAEDYKKIASYAELRPEGQRTFFRRLKDGIWLYRNRLSGQTEDVPYLMMAIGLYLLAIIFFITGKDGKSLAALVLLWMVRSALWVYLLMEGRYPERVIVSLYLIEFLVLFSMLAHPIRQMLSDQSIKDRKLQHFMQKLGGGLVGAVILILSLETGYRIVPPALSNLEKQLETNREEDRLFDTMKSHPENLYLVDVYSVVNHTEYVLKNYDPALENYLVLGGWIAGSPLVNDKLDIWGYSSAFEAFSCGENVFLVLKDGVGMTLEEWKQYYFQRTGEEPGLIEAEVIETGRGIYRIYQKAAD